MDKQRDSNIELLRCVLMFAIVVIHFVAHNLLNASTPLPFGEKNWCSSNLLLSFTECAVDCFVLISGYYGIKASFRKIALFLLPIAFYEFVISTIFHPLKGEISITPFNYWFVKSYFALMLLSPIINKGLDMMSKASLRILLLLLFVFYIAPIHSLSDGQGKNPFFFVVLYSLGYYIKHYFVIRRSARTYLLLYCICCALIFCETIVLSAFGKWRGYATLSYSYDNVLIVAAAVSLLLTFLRIKITSRLINRIASSAFYVYIITENINIYRSPYSIYDLLDVNSWGCSSLYVVYVIGFSLAAFAISISIDRVRVLLFGRTEDHIGHYADLLEYRIKALMSKP